MNIMNDVNNDKKKENNFFFNFINKLFVYIEKESIEINKTKKADPFYFVKKLDNHFYSLKLNYTLVNILYVIYLLYSLVNKDYVFVIYFILMYIIFYILFKKNVVIYVFIFVIANLLFNSFYKNSDSIKKIRENFSLKSKKIDFSTPKKDKKELSESEKDKIIETDHDDIKNNYEEGEEYRNSDIKIDEEKNEEFLEKQLDKEEEDDTQAKNFINDKDNAEKKLVNTYRNNLLKEKIRIY